MGVAEYVLITIVVEIIEIFLQYGKTLKESINKIYRYYQKTPFLFFISNIGYLWILYITISINKINLALVFAIILKSLDIFTKITLLNKLSKKEDLQSVSEFDSIFNNKLPIWSYFIGVLTYPYLVYIALT